MKPAISISVPAGQHSAGPRSALPQTVFVFLSHALNVAAQAATHNVQKIWSRT